MRKILVITVALVALFAAGCGSSKKSNNAAVKGPATYNVDIDAAAPPQFQIAAYFPGALTVRPGDTIVFESKSVGNPHTVTLGAKADRSNAPRPVGPKGENPAAFGPCFTDTAPTSDLSACPNTASNPATPPEFNGKGFWNSGVLVKPAPQHGVTLKIAANTPPGDYAVLCLLHSFMAGTIKVAANDADRTSPTNVAATAEKAATDAIAAASGLQPPAATAGNVTAGFGDRVTAVQGFAPQTIAVKVGQTVTWKAASPYEPHTVTFKSPFKSPSDPGGTDPLGDKSGGTYSGGATSSGIFGPAPFFPADSFSLKFAKAGTYPYVCVLHPGMAGTVTVS